MLTLYIVMKVMVLCKMKYYLNTFFEEGKIDIFKGVNFASNYSYEDIWTGTTIPKKNENNAS